MKRFVWIWTILLYFALLWYIPLTEPDEGRYSLIAQEMIQTGDWLTPHVNHAVYLEKPPLLYWLTACSFWTFGENEFGARFMPALFSLLLIFLVYRLAYGVYDPETALYSVMILAVSLFHFTIGRLLVLDMVTAFFIVWTIAELYWYMDSRKRRHLYLAYLASALALLSKGLIGIVLPGGVIVLFCLVFRKWRDLLSLVSPVGISLFLLVAGPWYIFMAMQYPGQDSIWGAGGFIDYFFVRHHFRRFLSGSTQLEAESDGSFLAGLWYFPVVALAGTIPYILLLPRILRDVGKAAWKQIATRHFYFLAIWAVFILVFFSLSKGRLIPYIAPFFPPFAIILGRTCYEWVRSEKKPGIFFPAIESCIFFAMIAALFIVPFFVNVPFDERLWWIASALLCLPFLALAILPFMSKITNLQRLYALFFLFGLVLFFSVPLTYTLIDYRCGKNIAQITRQYLNKHDRLVHFGSYYAGLTFYTRRFSSAPHVYVDYLGELKHGIEKLDVKKREELFPTLKEFQARWKGKEVFLCVWRSRLSRKQDGKKLAMEKLQRRLAGEVQILHWEGEYCLFTNRK